MRTGKFKLTCVFCLAILLGLAGQAWSEMIIETKDGRVFTLPLSQQEIKSIRYTSQAPSGAPSARPGGTAVFDNWNKAACQFTNSASFELGQPTSLSGLIIWYNWAQGETSVGYVLKRDGQTLFQGRFQRGNCDPYQRSWCEGISAFQRRLEPGFYTVEVERDRVCQNSESVGNGFVKVMSGGQASPSGQTASIGGAYDSGWGRVTLRQTGDQVTGQYPEDNGEIYGRVRGRVMDGYWIENQSKTRCSQPRNGRYYWGKLRMTFDGQGNFTGQWGYCDGALSESVGGRRVQ